MYYYVIKRIDKNNEKFVIEIDPVVSTHSPLHSAPDTVFKFTLLWLIKF